MQAAPDASHRRWAIAILAVVCLGGATACPNSTYSERVAEAAAQRAQYVESFAAPVGRVERAVRSGLSDRNFDIVGARQGERESRIIRGIHGEPGDPDSYFAYVLIRPDEKREGITTIYVDTRSATGDEPSAQPVYESIKKRLEDYEPSSPHTAVASGGGDGSTEGTSSTTETGASTASSAPADLVKAVPQSSAYALVVGIEDYRDLPSPTGAASDARRVAELMGESFGIPDDQIRTLVDDHATKSDIRAALDWVASSVPAGGRIYFYYAGHGSPDAKNASSMLLPYEASQKTLRQTGLALDEVMGALEQSGAKSVVAFVDACFSGQGGRSISAEGQRPTVPVDLVDKGERGASILYAASKSNQVSGPNAEEDGGLFTDFLMQGLGRGRADVDGDGQITVEELDTYVTPRVAREARKLSREQTPQLRVGSGAESGESLSLLWGLSDS